MCRFDVVSSFGFVLHPGQRNTDCHRAENRNPAHFRLQLVTFVSLSLSFSLSLSLSLLFRCKQSRSYKTRVSEEKRKTLQRTNTHKPIGGKQTGPQIHCFGGRVHTGTTFDQTSSCQSCCQKNMNKNDFFFF